MARKSKRPAAPPNTSPSSSLRRLLTPAEAADVLGLSPRTLETHRQRGKGPPYVRVTARTIRYRSEDVERFIAAQLRASTSAEAPPPEAS